MTPFMAEIRAFAFSFVPSGWIPCDGRLLPIQQYSALFSLLGTNYGGNGTTNFGVPNLQGTSLVSQGQGAGLSSYFVGEVVGSPTVTLVQQEMPMHLHAPGAKIQSGGNTNMHSSPQAGDQLSRYAPTDGLGTAWNDPPLASPVQLNPQMVQLAGGGQAHANQQPYLSVLYGIAASGMFPARN
jgi:microcystin-dependent protein